MAIHIIECCVVSFMYNLAQTRTLTYFQARIVEPRQFMRKCWQILYIRKKRRNDDESKAIFFSAQTVCDTM